MCVQRFAHTLLRSIGHAEAATADGHAMRLHVLRLILARMVSHHVAVLIVAEEVDAVKRRPAR
jgi:hypothetical protein